MANGSGTGWASYWIQSTSLDDDPTARLRGRDHRVEHGFALREVLQQCARHARGRTRPHRSGRSSRRSLALRSLPHSAVGSACRRRATTPGPTARPARPSRPRPTPRPSRRRNNANRARCRRRRALGAVRPSATRREHAEAVLLPPYLVGFLVDAVRLRLVRHGGATNSRYDTSRSTRGSAGAPAPARRSSFGAPRSFLRRSCPRTARAIGVATRRRAHRLAPSSATPSSARSRRASDQSTFITEPSISGRPPARTEHFTRPSHVLEDLLAARTHARVAGA